jgi:hypothetical protein
MQVGAGLGGFPIPALFDFRPMGVRAVPWSTSFCGPHVDWIRVASPLLGRPCAGLLPWSSIIHVRAPT